MIDCVAGGWRGEREASWPDRCGTKTRRAAWNSQYVLLMSFYQRVSRSWNSANYLMFPVLWHRNSSRTSTRNASSCQQRRNLDCQPGEVLIPVSPVEEKIWSVGLVLDAGEPPSADALPSCPCAHQLLPPVKYITASCIFSASKSIPSECVWGCRKGNSY